MRVSTVTMTRRLCKGPSLPGLALALATVAPAVAQDLSLTAMLQPESGCALSAAETVTVRVSNVGNALSPATVLALSYAQDAGPPVVELLVLQSWLLSNSTFDYTFATAADLSLPATYVLEAAVQLPGDTNPTNDALAGLLVSNAPPSFGGVLSAPASPTTVGTLTLAGHVGEVVEWQQSIDGARWRSLENRTATQAFEGLDRDTFFRAEVRSAPCVPARSNTVVVRTMAFIFADGFEQ